MTIALLYGRCGDAGLRILETMPVPATVDPVTFEVAEWALSLSRHEAVDVVEVWDGPERLSAWVTEEGPGTNLPDGAAAALSSGASVAALG